MNASLWTGVHTKSLWVLSKGHSGASIVVNSFVLDASWLTNPKNDLRSVRLLGIGNFDIASVISLLTVLVQPSGVNSKPAKGISVWQNLSLGQCFSLHSNVEIVKRA